MAADSGGRLFAEDNDLTLGMGQARDEVGSYYILGYYSTNTKTDGKYRTVHVKLNAPDIQNAKLDYKRGYFAEKEFGKFANA
jgi:VWFA-related protein